MKNFHRQTDEGRKMNVFINVNNICSKINKQTKKHSFSSEIKFGSKAGNTTPLDT